MEGEGWGERGMEEEGWGEREGKGGRGGQRGGMGSRWDGERGRGRGRAERAVFSPLRTECGEVKFHPIDSLHLPLTWSVCRLLTCL